MSDERRTPSAGEEGRRPGDPRKSSTMREADTANGEQSDDAESTDDAGPVNSQ